MMHLLVNENVILEESRFTPLVLLLKGFFGQLNSNNDVEFLLSTFLLRYDFIRLYFHVNFHDTSDEIENHVKLVVASSTYISKGFQRNDLVSSMIFMKNSNPSKVHEIEISNTVLQYMVSFIIFI